MGIRYYIYTDRGQVCVFIVDNGQVFAQDSGLTLVEQSGYRRLSGGIEESVVDMQGFIGNHPSF
jgi:hypothetical protein